jgi:CRP-like cAMP-binding protein
MTVNLSPLHDELEPLASSVFMPSGTILFRCGEPVSGIFVIRSGAISMYLDANARTHFSKMLGPGEIAGLPAALTGTYSLSAQVLEDAELGFIAAPKVAALLERSPSLCLVAARAMSDEIARMRSGLRETPPIH